MECFVFAAHPLGFEGVFWAALGSVPRSPEAFIRADGEAEHVWELPTVSRITAGVYKQSSILMTHKTVSSESTD